MNYEPQAELLLTEGELRARLQAYKLLLPHLLELADSALCGAEPERCLREIRNRLALALRIEEER